MRVYVDQDGVLANMEGYLQKLYGDSWKEELERTNWGDVAVSHQRMYGELPVMDDAYILTNWLNHHCAWEVLTAIPKRAHFPHSVNDKRNWCHSNFGIDLKVNFGPYAQDKQYWCEPGDILIDDMEMNIMQWRNAGGFGILHISAEDTINRLMTHFAGVNFD